jgi:hypothetical protein
MRVKKSSVVLDAAWILWNIAFGLFDAGQALNSFATGNVGWGIYFTFLGLIMLAAFVYSIYILGEKIERVRLFGWMK